MDDEREIGIDLIALQGADGTWSLVSKGKMNSASLVVFERDRSGPSRILGSLPHSVCVCVCVYVCVFARAYTCAHAVSDMNRRDPSTLVCARAPFCTFSIWFTNLTWTSIGH